MANIEFLMRLLNGRTEEMDAYHEAALALMERENVPVNDLRAMVAADPDSLLSEDLLHLSEAGIEACACAVMEAVRPRLRERP